MDLDLGYLALFVGMRMNELVLEKLHAAGFDGIRHAHGYVFQHLVEGPRTATVLAERLGVSQQMASKSIAELVELGFLEEVPGKDKRARTVGLSERGRACIAKTRSIREREERKILDREGVAAVAKTKELLGRVLGELGGIDAVLERRIRMPK